MFGLAARIWSTSSPSLVRTPGSLLVRNTSAVASDLVEDLESLRRGQVESDAPLAPVRVLEQRVDPSARRRDARRGQAPHRVAAFDVLDLDHVGAPVGEQRCRSWHERVLGDLEDAHTIQDCCHFLRPPSARQMKRRRRTYQTSQHKVDIDVRTNNELVVVYARPLSLEPRGAGARFEITVSADQRRV